MNFNKSNLLQNSNSKRLKEIGTFPTLESRAVCAVGDSSTAIDPEYAKVLEGSKHYSNYFLEHPELANKVRHKSLLKRLIGFHRHSIDIRYVTLILKDGVLETDVSDYDRGFIKSMFILLGLSDKPTAEDFMKAVFNFLADSGASEKEIVSAFLKQLCGRPSCPKLLGRRNKKITSCEAVAYFRNSGLEDILASSKKNMTVEQAKQVDSVLERVSVLSTSNKLLEVDLGFKVEVTSEERAYSRLSCYDYFLEADEAQKAVYVRRYLTWCSSYARFGTTLVGYLFATTDKDLHVIKREVIENYIKTGYVVPDFVNWNDFLYSLQGDEKLIYRMNSFRGVHD